MLKLEVKVDEKLIPVGSSYTESGIYGTIDKVFRKHDFTGEILNDGTHCYYGNGNPKDYGTFGSIITSLKDKDWFINSISKWLWYNSDDGEHDDDYSVEDILYHYTRRESIS